jgi:hypothetical protein
MWPEAPSREVSEGSQNFYQESSCDPKRDATITPSAENITIGEPSMQEAEPAVKSPKAPRTSIKKVHVARSTKRSKKSKEADVSLKVHDSTSSPDDVSDCPSLRFFV